MAAKSNDDRGGWQPPADGADDPVAPGDGSLLQFAGGKDELNLAEFPIAALTDRVPDGQTTLVFEDKLEQRGGPPIVRRLTIMGTHKHGLPMALDDEVLVGLIQLTKRRNAFTDSRVQFSRYELIELLGWPQSGQSYQRIEDALHRWVGVLLTYENAWWDNAAKSWVDENFHVLDNVSLYDRERRRPTGKANAKAKPKGVEEGKAPAALSSFRWNEVLFRSFQSGNLKQLDLEFYLRLKLPTTKRVFRFLDKRFYRRSRLDFDLRTLACEHIGVSRAYAATDLKRRLKPALEELERVGFLEPLAPEERYSQVERGTWRILLIRGQGGPSRGPGESAPEAEASGLVEALRARGVTARTAAEVVAGYPAGRVRTKVEVFDWLVENQDKRVGKNPAGYLVASVRADYRAPGDFPPGTPPAPPAGPAAAEGRSRAQAQTQAQAQAQAEQAEADGAREADLRGAWERLPVGERDEILAAVKAANPGISRWRKMLEPFCLAALEARLGGARQRTLFPDEAVAPGP